MIFLRPTVQRLGVRKREGAAAARFSRTAVTALSRLSHVGRGSASGQTLRFLFPRDAAQAVPSDAGFRMNAMRQTESAVLEREAELSELDSAFDHARTGHGQLALLEGPAGEGKSTLLAAASSRAQAAGLTVLTARGGEPEREFPFGVMRQLFEPVLAAADPGRRELLLGGAAAPAARALGVERQEGVEPVAEGPAALNAIYWLTANLASEGPVALAVDDVHWADASSLRALDFLARRVGDLPVALLAALRPSEPAAPAHLLDALGATPAAVRVALRPLGRESVARIVRSRLPGSDDATCEAALAATAGNPLYLHELLRSAAADPVGGPIDLAALAIPSLGDRVVRRTRSVAPEAGELARHMAVLGDGGRLEIAAALAGVDLDTAGRIAHRLRRIEVLSSEDPFRFVHPLVRRSIYDAMSITDRDAAHRAAAAALTRRGAPVEAIAAHLGALTPSGSVDVAEGLVAAGERATAQAAPDEAARWFQRALEEGAATPDPAAIMSELGLSQAALRDPSAIEHLRDALAGGHDPRRQAQTATALADVLVMSGRWTEAFQLTTTYRRQLGSDADALAQLAAVELMLAAYSPALAAASDLEPERLAHLTEGGTWAARALAAALAVTAAHRGERPARVLALVDRALQDDLLATDVSGPRWPLSNVLIALTDIDEYDRAIALSDRIVERARRQGSLSTQVVASDHRGWMQARTGDLALAEATLRAGLELAQSARMPTVIATHLFFLQDPLTERPSLEDVAELALTLDLGPQAEGSWPAAAAAMTRGLVRLGRRDRGEGIADLRRAAEIGELMQMGPTLWPVRSALALALAPSSPDEAHGLVARELELARATGLARPTGIALRAAGTLAAGPERIALLREAVALLASSQARLEHARALVALGSALRREQLRAESRAPLHEGLELAAACGATRLAVRAGEELQASGSRLPRHLGSHRDALTPSELRVVRLATEGATNVEIAQDLYVSLKTVETHLSHAYAKLGLAGRGSRQRLADALEGHALDAP